MSLTELLRQARQILDTRLFEIAGTRISPATLLSLVLIAGITLWISRLSQRAVVRLLYYGRVRDEGNQEVARRLVHYVVLGIGSAVALQTLGINLSAVFTAGAITAVAVGFAAQAIFENFASGLILLGERSIKPGDVLEVEGKVVRVVSMRFRSTIVRSRDEEEIILPNSMLVRGTVKNYTLRDSLYRLRAGVGVVYSSDMKQVRDVLQATADETPWRRPDIEPRVLLLGFGDSSVDWEVSVWIDNPWEMLHRRSQINEAIWWALKRAGITIAFPQLDVHFDPEIAATIGRDRTALGDGDDARADARGRGSDGEAAT